jgi:ketosteroid isomerase-like protein
MNTQFRGALLVSTLFALCSCAADGSSFTDEGPLGADDADAPVDAVDNLTLGEQIALIEQRLEATNTRDWDRWEALHAPDALRTAPELEAPLRGPAAMRAAIETLSVAFPDYHLELEQAFGRGEWLAVRLHTSGTMTGPLTLSDGTVVPPTGQGIEQDWTALVRFEGDRIAEFNEYYDQLTLMMQLGLLAP